MHRPRFLTVLVGVVALGLGGCGGEQVAGEPPRSQAPTEGLPGNPEQEPAADLPSDGAVGGRTGDSEGSTGPPAVVDEPPAIPEDVPEIPDDAPPAPAHAPVPETIAPYELSLVETLPVAKQRAIDVVKVLLTYDPGDEPDERLADLTDDRGVAALREAAQPVLHEDAWSRATIVYPQLGGFTDTSASVMVVARQTVGRADGEVVEQSRTFDVRLAVEDGEWVFDELASAGGDPVPRPDDLPEAAVRVLDDDRIELPDTARWDIHSGAIAPTLLELMSVMAERSPYGVVVLDTGHPWEVFGTDRQSSHSRGHAVDIYRLDGPTVIDDRGETTATRRFVDWLYDQTGMANMGAPWALDGFGGRSFSDTLHQDHLHVEAVRDA